MEQFDWSTFTLKVPIRATLEEVYAAWTSSDAIERWFLSKAVFKDGNGQALSTRTSVQKGCSYAWSWYGFDVVEQGRILEANGTDHLRFTFAGECPVDVSMKQDGGHIIVELTQSHIPLDEKSKRGIRLGCHAGWSFFLVNLKSVLEGGLDLRNKNEGLKGMVNS